MTYAVEQGINPSYRYEGREDHEPDKGAFRIIDIHLPDPSNELANCIVRNADIHLIRSTTADVTAIGKSAANFPIQPTPTGPDQNPPRSGSPGGMLCSCQICAVVRCGCCRSRCAGRRFGCRYRDSLACRSRCARSRGRSGPCTRPMDRRRRPGRLRSARRWRCYGQADPGNWPTTPGNCLFREFVADGPGLPRVERPAHRDHIENGLDARSVFRKCWWLRAPQ